MVNVSVFYLHYLKTTFFLCLLICEISKKHTSSNHPSCFFFVHSSSKQKTVQNKQTSKGPKTKKKKKHTSSIRHSNQFIIHLFVKGSQKKTYKKTNILKKNKTKKVKQNNKRNQIITFLLRTQTLQKPMPFFFDFNMDSPVSCCNNTVVRDRQIQKTNFPRGSNPHHKPQKKTKR